MSNSTWTKTSKTTHTRTDGATITRSNGAWYGRDASAMPTMKFATLTEAKRDIDAWSAAWAAKRAA